MMLPTNARLEAVMSESTAAESEDTSFQLGLSRYRQSLVTMEQAMQSEYDKAVIALSGGALAVSLTFLKDIIGTKGLQLPRLLWTSWGLFGTSILCVLLSYVTSAKACRCALNQTDEQTVFLNGGQSRWLAATRILNSTGEFAL